jgi:hypothetical protein
MQLFVRSTRNIEKYVLWQTFEIWPANYFRSPADYDISPFEQKEERITNSRSLVIGSSKYEGSICKANSEQGYGEQKSDDQDNHYNEKAKYDCNESGEEEGEENQID